MARITVTLRPDEREALQRLAEQEWRDPRAQAALLIRQGLERLELLEPLSQIHVLGARDFPHQKAQGHRGGDESDRG